MAHTEVFIGQIYVNIKTTVYKYTAFNKIDLIFGVPTLFLRTSSVLSGIDKHSFSQ